MDFSLSPQARANLNAMQTTQRMLSQTQVRLATGKRVNSALDNPSSFFQAKSLDNRAADLTRLLDQMSSAQSTVKAADNGLAAIGELIGQARGIAQQALQADGAASVVTATNAFATGSAGSLNVSIDGVATNVAFTGTATAQDFASAISSKVSGASASVNAAGRIVIEARDGRRLSIASSGSNGGFNGSEAIVVTPSAARSALAAQFNEVRTQIDEIAKDAGFNGVNLLRGDSLKVVFNEQSAASGRQSSLNVKGQTVDSISLGIGKVAAYTATTAPTGGFQFDTAIEASLNELTVARDKMEAISASYASDMAVMQIRQDFTNDMISTLKGGADELTLADPNEEGARMLALQTRQELASTALALSSQADRSVLRLF